MKAFFQRRVGSVIGMAAVLAALAPAPRVAEPTADTRKAAETRVAAAQEVLDLCREFLVAPPGAKGGPTPLEAAEQIQFWNRQLADARLELAGKPEERVAILTGEVERARGFEAEVKDLARNEASGLSKLSAVKATYYRADAEVRLAKEKATRN